MKKMIILAMIFVLAGCGVARTSDKALLAELGKLPVDVPVYPNGQIDSLDRDSFRVETGTYTLAQGVLIFDDQMPKVAGWYKTELEKQGWEIINLQDELIVSLKNGVHFQLIFKEDDGKTEVIYFMNPAK
jgi:hypothetical protein